MTGFLAYAGEWMYRHFGFAITDRSQVFFWCGLTSLLFSPIAGIWADRSGKRTPAVTGSILICLLMCAIPVLAQESLSVYPAFVVLAAGVALRHSPLLTLVTEVVCTERRGTFLAIKNAWTQLGAALGNLIAGILYNYWGYQAVGLFSCILTLVSIVLLIGSVLEPKTDQS